MPAFYHNQRIITTGGQVAIVAYQLPDGRVFVYAANGSIVPAVPCADAWGGEHDLRLGLAA